MLALHARCKRYKTGEYNGSYTSPDSLVPSHFQYRVLIGFCYAQSPNNSLRLKTDLREFHTPKPETRNDTNRLHLHPTHTPHRTAIVSPHRLLSSPKTVWFFAHTYNPSTIQFTIGLVARRREGGVVLCCCDARLSVVRLLGCGRSKYQFITDSAVIGFS